MDVAVIGAGVAGLVAARELLPHHQVTIFEAGDLPGGHAHTVDVDCGEHTYAVDTGFVVFNDRTYPELRRILGELRVPSQASEMSFSVRCDRSGVEYSGGSLNALFAQRRNLLRPAFLRLLVDYLRFNRLATGLLGPGERRTLGEYLNDAGFSRVFRDLYLVPMGAAVWSADPTKFSRIPVRTFARFFYNHGLLGIWGKPHWLSIVGGARRYVDALVQPFRSRIHLRAPVVGVRRLGDHVTVAVAGAGETRFDHVVFATHSDQALRALQDASPRERDILGAIDYQTNDVALHTDTSLLPRCRRAWASWNYRIPRDWAAGVPATYNMNRLQRLDAPETYCVTLNQTDCIRPAAVIKRLTYHHPVFNQAAIEAQDRWGEINGGRRTWYAGAYWRYGFHEDGVVSGLRAARALLASP